MADQLASSLLALQYIAPPSVADGDECGPVLVRVKALAALDPAGCGLHPASAQGFFCTYAGPDQTALYKPESSRRDEPSRRQSGVGLSIESTTSTSIKARRGSNRRPSCSGTLRIDPVQP